MPPANKRRALPIAALGSRDPSDLLRCLEPVALGVFDAAVVDIFMAIRAIADEQPCLVPATIEDSTGLEKIDAAAGSLKARR